MRARSAMSGLVMAALALGGCERDPETEAVPVLAAEVPKPRVEPGPDRDRIALAKGMDHDERMAMAMALWRDDDVAKHPKGSCAGCHGPDFIDLAVIGSTREDIERRARIDGATDTEARALALSVEHMRRQMQVPERNARDFRPFQPGGDLLLPDADGPVHERRVRRDIAFGQQMERLLPTLFGPRIDSLAAAQQARGEMLDVLHGTDAFGANPGRLGLRDLPIGLPYPQWSADLHHGEGTFNDWIADIAHDALPEHREAWDAVNADYLLDPSRNNFWRLYKAAEDMTAPQQLAQCTYDGRNPHLACGAAEDFNRNKFQSALMGQHLMREQLSGRAGELMGGGALAFAYIDTDPALDFMLDRPKPYHLPGNLWEVGDRARVMLDHDSSEGSFRRILGELGFPDFAQDSIGETLSSSEEQEDLRRAWFWLGFTLDPSFARIHSSNSTRVGEYQVASLLRVNMHMHNSFAAHMRIIAKGSLPEANVYGFDTRARQLKRRAPAMALNYSYFVGYNRTTLAYREDRRSGEIVPEDLKAEQAALWTRFNANAFRMGLELYLAEVESGAEATAVPTYPLKVHFDTYHPEHREADYALLNRVQTALGEAPYY